MKHSRPNRFHYYYPTFLHGWWKINTDQPMLLRHLHCPCLMRGKGWLSLESLSKRRRMALFSLLTQELPRNESLINIELRTSSSGLRCLGGWAYGGHSTYVFIQIYELLLQYLPTSKIKFAQQNRPYFLQPRLKSYFISSKTFTVLLVEVVMYFFISCLYYKTQNTCKLILWIF